MERDKEMMEHLSPRKGRSGGRRKKEDEHQAVQRWETRLGKL